MDACGVSLLAWFFRDIGVSSVTSATEGRLFCAAVSVEKTDNRSKKETPQQERMVCMNRKLVATLIGIGAVLSASWAVAQEQTAPEQQDRKSVV